MTEPKVGLPEVLIADDEESVCFSLKRVLESKGHVTHVAADGHTAVKIARARGNRVGVVFLDVVMPRMGGIDALEAIREILPAARCCLMTAHRRDSTLDWSRVESSVPVLDKPFELAEFVATLGRLVSAPVEEPPAPKPAFKRVAILLPARPGPWSGIVRGVARYARPEKPWLIEVHGDESAPASLRDCDGVIATVRTAALAAALRDWRGCAVDAGGDFPEVPCPGVGVDAHSLGVTAAEYLVQLGSRHFAFVGAQDSLVSEAILKGFTERLGASRTCLIAPPDVGVVGTPDATIAWLRSLPRSCAVFASDDHLALRLGEACRAAGLRVPEELALLGTSDNEILCLTAHPPLSSVRLPAETVGFEAARILDDLLNGKAAPGTITAFPSPGVTARQSTDVTAVADPDLAESLRYIREHAFERIGVEDIVAAGTLSRSSLERRFRTILGRSPLAELLRVRIERAEQLLIDTEMSIEEVARAAGFRDAGHLTVTFRGRGNAAPAQFRALHRRA